MKKEFLEAGKIVNTHGIKGEVKIQPWADSPEFLLEAGTLYIDKKPVRLLGGRVHKEMLIARLEGIEDVNEAMRLKNKVVFLHRDDVELEEGAFFIQDIIGAQVVSDTGEELGKLADVLEMPAGNIYLVQGAREIMIPAVPEFILETDVEAMKITVHLIEGM